MRSLFCLVLMLGFALTTSATQVYRWVDASGGVHFSDRPHQGADIIQLPRVDTKQHRYQQHYPQAQQTVESQPLDKTMMARPAEKSLAPVRLLSPRMKQTFQVGAQGNVSVRVAVAKSLFQRKGYIILLLDGEKVAVLKNQPATQLKNIARGTHKLQAIAKNAQGKTMSRSPVIIFYVHRAMVK